MTSCISQGNMAPLYRWDGKIYNLLVYNFLRIPFSKNHKIGWFLTSHWHHNQTGNWKQRLFSCKIRPLSWSFRHFGVRRVNWVNTAWNNSHVGSYVLNKGTKFGAKIFTYFWEIAVFVLARFTMTHPVYLEAPDCNRLEIFNQWQNPSSKFNEDRLILPYLE